MDDTRDLVIGVRADVANIKELLEKHIQQSNANTDRIQQRLNEHHDIIQQGKGAALMGKIGVGIISIGGGLLGALGLKYGIK